MDKLHHFASIEVGIFAGLSIVTAYWLLICVILTGWMCWEHKDRFSKWWVLSPSEKADATLNWGLFLFLFYALGQRVVATFVYIAADWRSNNAAKSFMTVAPWYIPIATVGLGLMLWWKCFHRFERYRLWWSVFICTGLLLYVITVFFIEL